MTRSLIYGGTFDPVHLGHVEVPHAAMLHLDFDQVIYVPAHLSPFKTDDPPTPSVHRLAMLDLALRDHAWASISNIELDRGGTSYTIDTLELLQASLDEGDEMRLLIGADQWNTFASWYRYEAIIEISNPVILPRGGYSLDDERVLPITQLPATSTQIRDLVRCKKSIDHLVDPQIAAYIAQHNLYR